MDHSPFFQQFDKFADTPNAVAKIRELVLQLGVQGHLVPQRPVDEPAKKLLAKIEAEKREFLSRNKLKLSEPEKIVDLENVPFSCPASWLWVRLGSISNRIHYGYTASADPSSRDIRLLRITDIQNNRVDWESVPGCEIARNETVKYELHENDILIARTGGTIGKTFLVESVSVKAVFASYLIRIIPSSQISAKYLKLFLESPCYWFQLGTKTAGTGQPNVNGEALSSLAISLPPLAEQKRIVAKVDELMTLCDELETRQHARREARTRLQQSALHHVVEARQPQAFATHWHRVRDNFHLLHETPESVAELRKTILRLAVQGRLVPQDPSDEPVDSLLEKIEAEKRAFLLRSKLKQLETPPLVEVEEAPFTCPDGWRWVRLGLISNRIHYGYTASADPSKKAIRLLRITDIQNNRVAWESVPGCEISHHEITKYELHENDILIARTGGTIGKTFLVEDLKVKAVFASYLIRVISSSQISAKYLKLFLESPCYWFQLGTKTAGTGQPNVNGQALSNLSVSLPPLAEQKRIVAKVDELMRLCDELENKLAQCNTIGEQLVESTVQRLLAS